MPSRDSEDLRTELRSTIHKLNNLLTTVFVQAESMLLTDPEGSSASRARSILDSAAQAEAVLKRCRARLLDPEPDLPASFPHPPRS